MRRFSITNLFFNVLVLFQTILSKIAWAMGPVCVVVAFGLIFFVIFVYFTVLLPHYLSSNYLGILSLFHIVFATWVSINIPFNYFMCITTSPGRTTETVDPSTLTEDQYEYEYCTECKAMKPERAHHCTVCNKCTLRMDHHCPWMANCVGHYNYKYFVLFLFYMAISCTYVAIIAGLPVKYGGISAKAPVPYFGVGGVEFIMLLCISVGAAVGFMFIWHLYLVVSQQTTIEFYQNQVAKMAAKKKNMKWVNVYDLGLHKNFDSVFGNNSLWFRWLLPSTATTPGDGKTFILRDDVVLSKMTYDV